MFKLWTLAAFCVLTSISAQATPTKEELAAFLNQTDRIRVAMTMSPGSGHQSAAAQTIEELRRMGYSGWIEVHYDANPVHLVRRKLSQVLPPYNDQGPGVQEFENLKIKFVPLAWNLIEGKHHIGLGSTHLPLAFTGGEDEGLRPSDLNVDTIVRVNPPHWESTTELFHRGSLVELTGSATRSFENGFPIVSSVADFVAATMGHTPSFQRKQSGLEYLLSNQSIDIAAIYGHNVTGGHQAQTYLRALVEARRGFESHFSEKSVVFLLNNHSTLDKMNLERQIRGDSNLNGKVLTVDIGDSTALRLKYEQMNAGDVLVVYTGGVSKPMFEHIYSRSNLPPVVKGVNSIDLMTTNGIPFLPSGHGEAHPADELAGNLTMSNVSSDRVVADSAYQHLRNSGTPWGLARAAAIMFAQKTFVNSELNVVARFIRETRTNPAVARAFAERNTRPRNFAESRVGNALVQLRELYLRGILAIRGRNLLTHVRYTSAESYERNTVTIQATTPIVYREDSTTANSCDGQFKTAN